MEQNHAFALAIAESGDAGAELHAIRSNTHKAFP